MATKGLQIVKAPPAAGRFMLVSNTFGYNIYAAHVAGQPDVEITDIVAEAAQFEAAINDATAMAKQISWACGYEFQPVACH